MASPTNAVSDPAMVRFARRVSHDLNNFSTVVRTYSELLLSELPSDSVARPDVEEIQRAAEGMVHYLQRVTRFSRAAMMRKVPLPAAEECRDAIATFTDATPARPVEFSHGEPALIEADPQWFRDVVRELLQNAHEAAPIGSPIVVALAVSAATVTLTVRDQGPGIPEAEHDLFEPFASGKHGIRGAGQGLAIALAFALALDGDLSGTRDGAETVITLRLPRRTPR